MSSLSGSGQGRFYIIGNCISYYIKNLQQDVHEKEPEINARIFLSDSSSYYLTDTPVLFL